MKEEYFEVINSVLKIKDEYSDLLAGKISIPNFSNATIIGNIAKNNSKITAVYFVDGATYIETNDSFQNATSLTTVKLPYNIEVIGNNTFKDCKALVTINLHDLLNLYSLGSMAFYHDEALELEELPVGLKDIINSDGSITYGIGANCFAGCKNINVTKLPEGIMMIATAVFQNCSCVNITNFGSADTPLGYKDSIAIFDSYAFYGTGKGLNTNNTLNFYFDFSDVTFGRNCFDNSGYNSIEFGEICFHNSAYNTMTDDEALSHAQEISSKLGIQASSILAKKI